MLSASRLIPGIEHGLHVRLEVRHFSHHNDEAVDLRRGRNKHIHDAHGAAARFAASDHPSPLISDGPVHCDNSSSRTRRSPAGTRSMP